MKQQQSASNKKPSRLCKFLLLLVGFKLCLLGLILLEPAIDFKGRMASDGPATNWSKTAFPPVLSGNPEMMAQAVADGPGATVLAASSTTEVKSRQDKAVLDAQSDSRSMEPAGRRISGLAFAASEVAPASAKTGEANRLTIEALNRRQEELARKEQDLKNIENALEARLQQMQGLEMRLQIMLKDAEATKDAKYQHLVDVLSNMKARQAATVIETLDEKIAVRILAGMRGRVAGEILTYADPVKAARLTESLTRMQMPFE